MATILEVTPLIGKQVVVLFPLSFGGEDALKGMLRWKRQDNSLLWVRGDDREITFPPFNVEVKGNVLLAKGFVPLSDVDLINGKL